MPSDDSDSDRDRNPSPERGRDSGPERDPSPPSNSSGPTDSSGPPDSPEPPDPSGPPNPSNPPGATPPSDPPPPEESRSFTERFEEGWERALDHLWLALVPLVASLLGVDNVRRVLGFREDFHLGLTFRFPSALPDLWTFVSVPNAEPGIHVSPTLFALPVLIPVQAALVAGLLGSVNEAIRTGEYDFAANARRYFVPLLVYVALVRVAGLAAFSVGAIALPLVILLFPAFVLLSYFFYATPYLLVVADSGVEEALSRSYEWGLDGGPYFSYGGGYLLFVAAVSLVGTLLVVNLRAVGILLGAFAGAPVALALTFTTTQFVAEMAGSDASGGGGGGGVSGSGGSSVGGSDGSGVDDGDVGGSGGGGGAADKTGSDRPRDGEADSHGVSEHRNGDGGNADEASSRDGYTEKNPNYDLDSNSPTDSTSQIDADHSTSQTDSDHSTQQTDADSRRDP